MSEAWVICKNCGWDNWEKYMSVCPQCGNNKMIHWSSEYPDLANSFIAKYDRLFNNKVKQRIELLEETNFKLEHPGHKIDRVLSRLKLVELLHTNETHGQFIEAGFYQETSLRLYLTCTCFDIMGQNKNFIDFKSWLKAKSGEKGKRIKSEREQAFSKINLERLNSEEKLIEAISLFHDEWTKLYGMNRAFHNFFTKYLDRDDRALLLSKMWIGENKYFPEYTTHLYGERMPESWLLSNNNDKLKKIVDALSRLIRNSFTHNGIRIIDQTDKNFDFGFPFPGEIEAILIHNSKIKKCVSEKQFNSLTKGSTYRFSSVILGTDGEKVLAYSDSKFNERELRNNFLDHIRREFLKGGDIYFPDLKRALCFRNCSITKLLYHLAEKGLYNFIVSISDSLK